MYENKKLSITKIGNKIGLSKGSVMVLLKQAKVILRENRTTSYGDSYWRNHIQEECKRRGLTAVYIPSRLSKWSKVRVYCECGGEREVLVTGLKLGQTCCRHFSKQGERNPMKGKEPPNKGKKISWSWWEKKESCILT